MALLSRKQILEADDFVFEDVSVPEWGGTVRVGVMSAKQRGLFEKRLVRRQGKNVDVNMAEMRQALLVETVIDEDGKPLFTQADIEYLSAKSAAAVDTVFAVAQRVNKMTDDDVKQLTESFFETATADSPTD